MYYIRFPLIKIRSRNMIGTLLVMYVPVWVPRELRLRRSFTSTHEKTNTIKSICYTLFNNWNVDIKCNWYILSKVIKRNKIYKLLSEVKCLPEKKKKKKKKKNHANKHMKESNLVRKYRFERIPVYLRHTFSWTTAA
jgi:hypothetical protein